jgi:hypothetical protein
MSRRVPSPMLSWDIALMPAASQHPPPPGNLSCVLGDPEPATAGFDRQSRPEYRDNSADSMHQEQARQAELQTLWAKEQESQAEVRTLQAEVQTLRAKE